MFEFFFGKAYTSQACPLSSPAVSYFYDQTSYNGLTISNGVGRRTGMSDAAGMEAWSYDAMGRPLTDRRTTNSVTKNTSYTYNLDGSVATLTYPSGRVITYKPSGAGRTLSAVDVANSINYGTGALYSPQGAPSFLQNGAGLYSTFLFNNRLQPCWMYVATTTTGAPANCTQTGVPTAAVLDFKYDFGLGVADNGNVNGITNNRDTTRSQSFTYDTLNRVATAKTSSTTGSKCWGETFSYDIWANLLTIGGITPQYSTCTQEMLNVGATVKNQISGDTYDAAGNLTATPAPASASYTYDAENRLTTTAGVTYTYDGDGKRVQKSTGKLYWYGMGSDPLDETDLAGNTNNANFYEYVFFGGKRIARRDSSGNVNYYFADHLGTARIVANASGTVLDDSDFYPFGGERVVLSSSGNNYKFTGKERDGESGLDNFGARYMESNLGRFMTPDWSAAPLGVPYADFGNPQSLNLYSYLKNNPLNATDPDGHGDIWDRVKEGGAGLLNIGIGIVKVGIATGLGAVAPETGGASAVGAAYVGISAAGNLAAGSVQVIGALTGKTEEAEKGAQAVAAVTTVSGAVTLAVTGDVNKAASIAAVEGLITTNPADIAKGSAVVKAIKAADYANNAKEAGGAAKDAARTLKPPPPPPPPTPPPPPPCATDKKKSCG